MQFGKSGIKQLRCSATLRPVRRLCSGEQTRAGLDWKSLIVILGNSSKLFDSSLIDVEGKLREQVEDKEKKNEY